MTHLLTLEDQLTARRTAYDNLALGGRFVVDVTMPDSLGRIDHTNLRDVLSTPSLTDLCGINTKSEARLNMAATSEVTGFASCPFSFGPPPNRT